MLKVADPEERTEGDVAALRTAKTSLEITAEVQNSEAGKALAAKAGDLLKSVDNRKLDEVVGSSKPMTAVLFSAQDRNEYEVIADPDSSDPAIGLINQSKHGVTGGVLVAAEAPFFYPSIRGGPRVPIGAWFGVNLSAGAGQNLGVGLAAGFSVSFISEARVRAIVGDGRAGLASSAKLLLGVIYGEVAALGPKSAGETLKVGDAYPLGHDVPVSNERQIDFAVGLGFRF